MLGFGYCLTPLSIINTRIESDSILKNVVLPGSEKNMKNWDSDS